MCPVACVSDSPTDISQIRLRTSEGEFRSWHTSSVCASWFQSDPRLKSQRSKKKLTTTPPLFSRTWQRPYVLQCLATPCVVNSCSCTFAWCYWKQNRTFNYLVVLGLLKYSFWQLMNMTCIVEKSAHASSHLDGGFTQQWGQRHVGSAFHRTAGHALKTERLQNDSWAARQDASFPSFQWMSATPSSVLAILRRSEHGHRQSPLYSPADKPRRVARAQRRQSLRKSGLRSVSNEHGGTGDRCDANARLRRARPRGLDTFRSAHSHVDSADLQPCLVHRVIKGVRASFTNWSPWSTSSIFADHGESRMDSNGAMRSALLRARWRRTDDGR